MPETKQQTRATMPKLGESVTEGTIAGWLKQVGDQVEKYEPMVEVITDKVNAEVPAPVTGRLTEIAAEEGAVVPVGELICIIESDSGEDVPAEVEAVPSESETEEAESGDRTVVMSAAGIDEIEPAPEMLDEAETGGNGHRQERETDLRRAREQRDEAAMLRIRSSPLVRRLAEEHDIDLAQVEGTGMGGRVTKSDIEAYLQQRPEREAAPAEVTVAPPAEARPAAAPSAPGSIQLMPGDEVLEASPMRRQIAEHMVRSVRTSPHVTVWMEVDMSRVVAFRDEVKERFQEREGLKLTYLPIVSRVVIDALREHPEINSAWDDGRIIRRKAVNLGVAVALEDGLIVPVIKGADEKNALGLARAMDDLVSRAREGKLTPDDVSGGTFTINNPGTLGSLFSTPIIVQPQAAILSMEAIVRRPVVVGDMIGARPMMNLSLSVDHRLLDGLIATRFLANIRDRLEAFEDDGSL